MIRIVVLGRPVPKDRHRFGRGVFYSTERTREYEHRVGWEAKAAGARPLKGPVEAELHFYLAPGKPMPDVDNLAKSALDGLKGVAYKDDRQVIRFFAERHEDLDERAEIIIKPYEEVAS